MKLLIVDNSVLGEGLALILTQSTEVDVIMSSHKDALETFLLEDPTHVLICESWDETADSKIVELGELSLEDIRNSASTDIIIRTIGFDAKNDLVHLFEIKDVLASLQI